MSAREGATQALGGVDMAWGRAYEEGYNVGREGVVRVGGTRGAARIGIGVQEGGRSSTPLGKAGWAGAREVGRRERREGVLGDCRGRQRAGEAVRRGIVALELLLTSAREGGVREEREAAGGGSYGGQQLGGLREGGSGVREGWVLDLRGGACFETRGAGVMQTVLQLGS
ncbi:hypothetical protein B0H16DRAFT_1467997 [Mycena metata]|uniref:Uncharacterized protein n=1 Tax=Mycena metata TaxID=1033252 RepID=A0AAD7I2S1_9AGAR|nr:hypothetical protein B0H16DRAFT_1467997 [Mycena metata]